MASTFDSTLAGLGIPRTGATSAVDTSNSANGRSTSPISWR